MPPSPGIDDLLKARRILCVQPHYDDNDICAGGTLAALHDRGAELIYLTVTDDLVGVLDASLPDEIASERLRAEQLAAGEIIGVGRQLWLGYPDAGDFSYFDLRRQIVRYLRLLKPDFVFTCDPWLPYEAHLDHIRTGRAVAEAAILYNLPRFASDPAVDSGYQPYELGGIAFYMTNAPNLIFDISLYEEKKHKALRCYQEQFTAGETALMLASLEAQARQAGQAAGFQFGEELKLLSPRQLHIDPHSWKA
jgi:LmbE family N-acetylglucosaminyl deacetylase